MSSPTSELDEDDTVVDSVPLSKRMKVASSGELFSQVVCCVHCIYKQSSHHMQLAGSKQSSKGSIMDLLKVKSERKANQRDKELELKKLELQLQERKFALEEEERWKRLENEVERQRIEAEERKTWLELIKKNM